MGKIKLEGIEVMARIGLLEEELFAPQDLRVTVELTYDFETIRETDEITDGIIPTPPQTVPEIKNNHYPGEVTHHFD